jgi:hypothetical protein
MLLTHNKIYLDTLNKFDKLALNLARFLEEISSVKLLVYAREAKRKEEEGLEIHNKKPELYKGVKEPARPRTSSRISCRS